jgi:hypothetical protein
VSLPLLVDLDLRDPTAPDLPDDRPVHALLWWGDHVLGQASLPAGVHRWEDLRQELTAPVHTRVRALESIRGDAPLAEVQPGQVTVVVCTRERPDLLAGCLEALHRLDPGPAEVVVVETWCSGGEPAGSSSRIRG